MIPVQIISAPFPKVNATTFDIYFHDRDSDIDYGHGYKEISKTHFATRSGTIM